MAEITANLVKELREKTDAPMMECKKALAEAAGDLGKAEAILRIKLGNKASKAAARVAAEGVVAAHIAVDQLRNRFCREERGISFFCGRVGRAGRCAETRGRRCLVASAF
jgi:hypothetical protein